MCGARSRVPAGTRRHRPLRLKTAGRRSRRVRRALPPGKREVPELPAGDAQQLVVLLPADHTTAHALDRLRLAAAGPLRGVN